jgi:hypothetical protein
MVPLFFFLFQLVPLPRRPRCLVSAYVIRQWHMPTILMDARGNSGAFSVQDPYEMEILRDLPVNRAVCREK